MTFFLDSLIPDRILTLSLMFIIFVTLHLIISILSHCSIFFRIFFLTVQTDKKNDNNGGQFDQIGMMDEWKVTKK